MRDNKPGTERLCGTANTVLALWASVATTLEEEAAEEIVAVCGPLPRPVKRLQGQVLFEVPMDRPIEQVAASIDLLQTVDYVHVLLVSSKLTSTDECSQPEVHRDCRGLRSIRALPSDSKYSK